MCFRSVRDSRSEKTSYKLVLAREIILSSFLAKRAWGTGAASGKKINFYQLRFQLKFFCLNVVKAIFTTMKCTIILIFSSFVCINSTLFAQFDIQKKINLGILGFDEYANNIISNEEEVLISGSSYVNIPDFKLFLKKVNKKTLNVIEHKIPADKLNSISQIMEVNGAYYGVGFAKTNDISNYLVYFKLNANLELLWSKHIINYAYPQMNSHENLIYIDDDKFLFAFSSAADSLDFKKSNGGSDIWLCSFSGKDGDMLWKKNIGGEGDENYPILNYNKNTKDILLAFETLSKTGLYENNLAKSNICVMKIDKEGNSIWQKIIGTAKYEFPSSIRILKDDSIILLSENYNNLHDAFWNMQLFHFENKNSGKVLHTNNSFPEKLNKLIGNITITDNDDIFVTVASEVGEEPFLQHFGNNVSTDNYILSLNKDLSIKWIQNLGGTRTDGSGLLYSYNKDLDYVVSTTSYDIHFDESKKDGTFNIWYFQLKDKSNYSKECIEKFSVYPNPLISRQDINLKFDKNYDASGEVRLFDSVGRLLYQTNANISGDEFLLPINLSLSSGIYFVQLTCDKETVTQKVIVR